MPEWADYVSALSSEGLGFDPWSWQFVKAIDGINKGSPPFPIIPEPLQGDDQNPIFETRLSSKFIPLIPHTRRYVRVWRELN